ncbi:MAG: histone deacetylase [Deltaproteobacteria bacterium]|nr:histone deacetylase [Deltaproteobacteria bacterium]
MHLSPSASLAVVSDPVFTAHSPSGFHPERPERLGAALRGLARVGAPRVYLPAREATLEELARVHHPAYLERLQARLAGRAGMLDGDTYFNAHSREAAWRAAGGACEVVDALLQARAPVGALLARPPGHHCLPDRAMGFCLLNNIAVAAAHARARGVPRVAIVDWDVHHGNGTQAIFERDPAVLFVSLHESPLYPGSGHVNELGAGDGLGRTINLPFQSGSDGRDYAQAFQEVVLPLVTAHRPELLLVSAGFDAHARDPLSSLKLDAGAFAWMASALRGALPAVPVGFFLEGGYDLTALEDSVAAALGALVDPTQAPALQGRNNHLVSAVARTLRRSLEPYWPGAL